MSSAPAVELGTLAVGSRILAGEGHLDLSLGHLSMRDPAGRGFWIKAATWGLDEVRRPDQHLLVAFDGTVIGGDGPLHQEWPIHAEIYRAREDVGAVGHTHALFAAALSATDDPLRPLTHAGCFFAAGVPRFTGTGNLIRTAELGRALAECLGPAPAVLMRNHGATFCAATVEETVVTGLLLERAARVQLLLRSSALELAWSGAEETEAKRATIYTPAAMRGFWDWSVRRLRRLEEGVAGEAPADRD